MAAASFSLEASEPSGLARALREARREVRTPSLGALFVTARLGPRAEEVARVVAAEWPGVPTIIGVGAGVVSDRGTHEEEPAAAGILASGGAAAPIAVEPDDLGAALGRARERRATSFVLLAAPDALSPGRVDEIRGVVDGCALVGGGTAGPAPLLVGVEGDVTTAPVVGLALRGLRAQAGVSPGARLIGAASRVSASSGALVLELGGRPALDVLTEATRGLAGRPLVLALWPGPDAGAPLRGGRLAPIRGVDPTRRAVALGEAVEPGAPLAFVVVDPEAARSDLEALARELAAKTAGAMPAFGVLVTCAGRRSGFYGGAEVESRILRQRLDRVPFAGLHSSFEIGPSARGAAVHAYSAAVALFSVPS